MVLQKLFFGFNALILRSIDFFLREAILTHLVDKFGGDIE